MKLKELLHVVYYENEVRFVILDRETDDHKEFKSKVFDKQMEQYDDYFVCMVDMEENTIVISDYDFYE